MNYEPTKEEIDLISALLDNGGGFWTPELILEILKQTKIFHYIETIKVLKIKDGENYAYPGLQEIESLAIRIEELIRLMKEEKEGQKKDKRRILYE